MSGTTPVLDTLTGMTEVSIERGTLETREVLLVRLAGLIAADAPVASYFYNIGPAAVAQLTFEDVQGVLIGVAPIVGTPHVVRAAENIAKAFGFEIELLDEELEVVSSE